MRHSQLLKNPGGIVGFILLLVGSIFLLLAIMMAGIGFAVSTDQSLGAVGPFMPLILGGPFGLSGLGMFIPGLILTLSRRRHIKTLEDLKDHGMRHNAEIIRLDRRYNIRINNASYVVVTAQCTYTNKYGMKTTATSRPFTWLDLDAAGLVATVYTDHDDPDKYAVEMAMDETADLSGRGRIGFATRMFDGF
ncbi:MAG: hypothetical protein FWC93_00750 [Defluviitaleaceae bacterium]|nr:hypothetical protein [Defluviitaleaceae bacterium]